MANNEDFFAFKNEIEFAPCLKKLKMVKFGFHQANRGMKLKQLHPAQIPPETKYEVVKVV